MRRPWWTRHPYIVVISMAIAGLASSLGPAMATPDLDMSAHVTTCPNRCVITPSASALPNVLLAGESTTVTLRLKTECTYIPDPRNVVFAINPTTGIDGRELTTLRDELHDFVHRLDLPHQPTTRVALVDGGLGGRTLSPLVNDVARLQQGIRAIDIDEASTATVVLQEAQRVLARARSQQCTLPNMDEVIVLITAEIPRSSCADPLAAARSVEATGMRVVVLNASRRSREERCLREMASRDRYYFQREWSGGLIHAIDISPIHRPLFLLTTMQVVETLPDGIDYVDGSAQPPADFDADTRQLTWRRYFLPRDGITLTYRARSRLPGPRALGEGAEVTWTDYRSVSGSMEMEPARAHVFAAQWIDP